MGTDDTTAEETANYIAIQRLLAAYADAVNRRAWSEFSELFRPDAKIDVTPLARSRIELDGPVALGEFIDGAIARFDFFQFVFLNTAIEIQPDQTTARGRNTICEYRRTSANAEWTQTFGVYHDNYRRIDGRWWFEKRDFSPLGSWGTDNRVFGFPSDFEDHLSGRQ